ncbi:unnamed protein product [Menidia menidia]|uniref:Insulin gene enhancer protein ISL-1 n=1 Tax=Menidia menidia TaxID=238744 RepID=A0A8S4B4V0_9TELE|nr:unnamed protein product [Menidia menidia]
MMRDRVSAKAEMAPFQQTGSRGPAARQHTRASRRSPAVTVDLTEPHFADMGDMGDPPKKKRLVSLCVGCGNQIHDQYILRVSPDLEWHAACLKCAECSQYLDESCTCFVRDGKTYCKRDYISRQLIPGDEFALREDGLFCRADHDVVERASLGSGDPLSPLHPARPLQMAGLGSGVWGRVPVAGVQGPGILGRGKCSSPEPGQATDKINRELMSEIPPVISAVGAEPISARQPALRPHVHKQPEKTTRVRTVLNEKQLHTLRTCYNANPRPDALMKEQLVEMTGLSPRVIRVWFQNKRCKDKKRSLLMKQLQQQQPNDKTVRGPTRTRTSTRAHEPAPEKSKGAPNPWNREKAPRTHAPRGLLSHARNIQGMTGTPMVAASPERHDGGLQANPVEVQSYQPPWKVLSDFALQSDIDQPAFQQLVSFSEGGPGSNSTGSEVASMSSQLPDTPNSMVSSPIEA